MNEIELYPQVVIWAQQYLQGRHPRHHVEVYDTHAANLSRFIVEKGLQKFFPHANVYDIKVDISAFLKRSNQIQLAFIECKVKPITLRDLGQILAYARVANPAYAFILSPRYLSPALHELLVVYRKYDLLEYAPGKKIRIGKWNLKRKELDTDSLLPPGTHLQMQR